MNSRLNKYSDDIYSKNIKRPSSVRKTYLQITERWHAWTRNQKPNHVSFTVCLYRKSAVSSTNQNNSFCFSFVMRKLIFIVFEKLKPRRRKLAEPCGFFWRFVQQFKDTRQSRNIFTDVSSHLNQNSPGSGSCSGSGSALMLDSE